jgi:hypothetical protein
MDFEKAHQGKHRQAIPAEEAGAMGTGAGIDPDLHASDHVTSIVDQPERNLHGDVPGSPYAAPDSATVDANAPQGTPRADDAETRAREMESRKTGVPTETLAAEDEAEGDDPKPKPKRAGK